MLYDPVNSYVQLFMSNKNSFCNTTQVYVEGVSHLCDKAFNTVLRGASHSSSACPMKSLFIFCKLVIVIVALDG